MGPRRRTYHGMPAIRMDTRSRGTIDKKGQFLLSLTSRPNVWWNQIRLQLTGSHRAIHAHGERETVHSELKTDKWILSGSHPVSSRPNELVLELAIL